MVPMEELLTEQLVKVNVPESVRQALKIEAASRGLTMTQLLTELITAAHNKPRIAHLPGSNANPVAGEHTDAARKAGR